MNFFCKFEHWTFHLMTDKKDTIIAQYDVAFSISQEGKRAQWYLYEDLTDDYRKKYPTMDIHSVIRMQTLTLIDFYYLS